MSVVICPHCGAKIRAGRERCLRCAERLDVTLPAPRFDGNRLAAAALIGFLCLTTATLVTLWQRSSRDPQPAPPRAAARPVQAPAAVQPAPRTSDAAGTLVRDVPFVDPNRAGNAAYADGDYDRALELYREAVSRNPQDAESWSNLGQVLVRRNRVEEAIAAFQRAIALNARRWAYHFNLARAHGVAGRWPQAVEEYRVAQQLYPEDYVVAFNLGLALRKSGDEAAALEQFKKASSLDPQEPTFQLSIAVAYEKLGQAQNAAAAYRRTLELAPLAPEADAIRARIDALVK